MSFPRFGNRNLGQPTCTLHFGTRCGIVQVPGKRMMIYVLGTVEMSPAPCQNRENSEEATVEDEEVEEAVGFRVYSLRFSVMSRNVLFRVGKKDPKL